MRISKILSVLTIIGILVLFVVVPFSYYTELDLPLHFNATMFCISYGMYIAVFIVLIVSCYKELYKFFARYNFIFLCRNHPIDDILNGFITKALKTNLISVNVIGYYIELVFENGLTIKAWDKNKWYSWFSRGNLKCNSFEYTWNCGMLSKKTMGCLVYKILSWKK